MNMNFIGEVQLTDDQIRDVQKLLNNGWSAEYALRIPTLTRSDLRHALDWTFPQAYFSAFYSLRAVLRTMGEQTARHDILHGAAESLYMNRLYEGTSLERGYYAELYTALDEEKVEERYRLKSINPAVEQARLIGIVEQFQRAHEGHILAVLGPDVFGRIVASSLDCVRREFLTDRVGHQLLTPAIV